MALSLASLITYFRSLLTKMEETSLTNNDEADLFTHFASIQGLLANSHLIDNVQTDIYDSTYESRKPCKPAVFKSRLCVFNAAGRCSHGDQCTFAHSAYELADPKTFMCPKAEQFGFCDDEVCLFAHNAGEMKHLPKVAKTALCRYYPIGKCRAGNACRHAHGLEEIDQINTPSILPGLMGSVSPIYTPAPTVTPQDEPAIDLRGLQHSLLALALELEKLRTNEDV